jgi:hypothetical protein
LAYADVEGNKLLGVSNWTRIYTASCPRSLQFYSYYFFVALGTTEKHITVHFFIAHKSYQLRKSSPTRHLLLLLTAYHWSTYR